MRRDETHLLDPGVVEHFTGQRLVCDLGQAQRLLDEAESASDLARRQLQAGREFERDCEQERVWAEVALACRRTARVIQNAGWSPALAATVAAGLWALFLALFLALWAPHSFWVLIIFVMGVGFGGLVLFNVFADTDVERAAVRLELAAQDWSRAYDARRQAEAKLQRCLDEQEAIRTLHQGLQEAAGSQLNCLLQASIHQMDGPEFERYLQEVFTALGHQVQHTGRSGDQGVDLIVRTSDTLVAVQAKCWQAAVGNSAVQEAYAGKTFHRCSACAVVTNSWFTESARMLAVAVGCQLIEGKDLRALIVGELRLGQGA